MPLTGPRDMFAKALAGGFAVGAFNINNMETVQGILQAAGDERSPVILQVSNGARQYAGRGYLRKMAEAASEETDVPLCCIWITGPFSTSARPESTTGSLRS